MKILKLLMLMVSLIIMSGVVYGGTESLSYQTNISIVGCSIVNGSYNTGSIFIETTDTTRTYNASITANYSFTSNLIFNLTELSCQKLTCTLNQSTIINQGNVTLICPPPSNITVICAPPVMPIEEELEEPKEPVNYTPWVIGGIIVLGAGYFIWKRNQEGNKKEVKPEVKNKREDDWREIDG